MRQTRSRSMLIEHDGKRPNINPTAGIAANAVICGDVTVGPHAHLSGCRVEHDVIVHIRTVLPPATSVPIQWIAVGDPPELFSPNEHERLLEHLQRLEFSSTVFGVERTGALGHMPEAMRRYTRALSRHRHDQVLQVPDSGDAR